MVPELVQKLNLAYNVNREFLNKTMNVSWIFPI